jgi:uncharacterized protein YcfJ
MMNAILGSALGGLAAGAIALVASAQGRPAPAADPWALQAGANTPRAMTVADARGLSTATTNAPTMVQCEPQQEAVLRRSVVAGREVAEVTCVSTRPAPGYDPAYFDGRPAYAGQSDIVPARPAARTVAAQPRTVRQTVYRTEPRSSGRSWKKTALVIGGSTGAGAGIGAIAGGKKGALIGAAIGGGAASIYEATKRR